MNYVLFLLLMSPLLAFGQNQPDSNKVSKYLLEGGAIITLKLLNEINSKTANEGDIIPFALAEDVTVGKMVVIKKGALVNGTIEKAQNAKGLGIEGEITYSLQFAKAVDGSKIYLRTTRPSVEGENRTGSAVALGVIVTPLFLLKKGRNIKMEPGKLVQAYVDRDYTIEIEKK